MFKRIFLVIICVMIGVASTADAKKKTITFSDLRSRLRDVENPFSSQLPKREEPVIKMPDKPPVELKPAIDEPETPKPVRTPSVIKEEPLPNITINGIVWNSDRPQAIINGKIVDIGDTVSEIQITNIQKARVDGLFFGKRVIINQKGARYE